MLPKNLLHYRKMLHLSQEEVAERLGVSRQTYAKWEAGDTTPELKYCRYLAELYNITLDELVEDRDLRLEGPPGKSILGIVTPNAEGMITLPPKAMSLFGIRPGDKLLLLADERQGLALVSYTMYERFARKVLEASDTAEEDIP